MRRSNQLVLALFMEKVSLLEASWVLSPKCNLLKLGVRSYTAWHARVLMIGDKDEQNGLTTRLTSFYVD
jgi:hypothetical protein